MGSECPCLRAGQCSGPGAKPFPSKADHACYREQCVHQGSSSCLGSRERGRPVAARMPLGQSPSPFPSGMPCRQGTRAPPRHGRFSPLSRTMGLHRGFLPLPSVWQALLLWF